MLRFCKKMLQYYQYSIYSKYWLLMENTSTVQDNTTTIMLIWCLKQLKDFILKFSISGSFFSFFFINTCFFSFRWCVDEATNSWTNYHRYKYDLYFLHYHTLTTIHFMDHERLCQIIYICLNHCWWCEHNQS